MAITRYSHKGFCPVCGQPILHPYKVKDGEICRECAAKLRVMYPVSYKKIRSRVIRICGWIPCKKFP